MLSMDKYLTTEEVAQIYRIDEETVRRWCNNKKLKAIKVGRKWLIEKDILNLDENNI